MKGTTKIELKNVKTGEVRTYEKCNIVTNAVKDILQQNPYGIRYAGNKTRGSTNGISWSDVFFPVYEKMFGGILLFKTALAADATKYHQPAELTGCANGGTNPGTDSRRGTRNLAESGPVTGGYKYVYDFSTSQGNGTIACISLTHSYAGATGFSFIGPDLTDYKLINDMSHLDIRTQADYNSYKPAVEGICCIDSDGIGISVMPTDTKKIKIRKYKTGLNHILLMDAPFDKLISESEITAATFGEKGSDSNNEWFNLAFVDGGDYIWGFQFSGNLKYTNPSPTLNWIKIKKSDLTFTEGSTVLTGCTCWRPGIVEYSKSTNIATHRIYTSCLVNGGYLYLLEKEYSKLYKVNLSNMSDISEITLPAACDVESPSDSVTYYRYMYGFSALNFIGETIVGSNFYLAGNVAHARANGHSALQVSRPGLSKGAYIVGIDFLGGTTAASGETTYNGSYRYVTLPLNYQATINNLDTPVTKTAEQTMKITYTLTEE